MQRGLAIILLLALGGVVTFFWLTQGPDSAPGDTAAPAAAGDGSAPVGPAASERSSGRIEAAERTKRPAPSPKPAVEQPSTDGAERADATAAQFAVRVRGRVFDWQGRPVAAVKVGAAEPEDELLGNLEWADASLDWVSTDAEGRFELGLKEHGAFRLIARAKKFPRQTYEGRADAAVVDGIVITLRRPGSIAGRVLGIPATGDRPNLMVMARPVSEASAQSGAAALINLGDLMDSMGMSIGSHSASVAEDGSFELEGLDPKRRYSLWASRVGKLVPSTERAAEFVAQLESGGADAMPRPCTAPVVAQVDDRNVQLRYAPPTVVTFRVVDEATGAPLEDLSVAVGWMSTVKMLGMSVPIANPTTLAKTSFPGGRVLVDRLAVRGKERPSKIALHVSAPGYRLSEQENVEVRVGQQTDLGDIRLRRSATVRVLVTAAGEPARGVAVRLYPEKEKKGTGSLSMSTSLPSASASNTDSASVAEPLEEPLEEPVVELEDRPVDDLPIDPLDRLMFATTDAGGRCELTFPGPGKYRIVAEPITFARAVSEPIDAPERGAIDHRIRLTRGGTVRVTVVDARGAPVPRARIARTGPGGTDEDQQSTVGDGAARFENLTPGEHEFALLEPSPGGEGGGGMKFNISGLSNDRVSEKVVVVSEQQTELQLVQPTRCTMTGVVRVGGEPLDGAVLRSEALDVEQGSKSALASEFAAKLLGQRVTGLGGRVQTDDEGSFRIAGVPVGERRIVLSHKSLAMPLHRTVQLREGENRIDFDVRLTRVTGRVVDASGKPVRGARVSVYVPSAQIAEMRRAFAAVQSTLGAVLGGSDQVVRTNSAGEFELRGVRPETRLEVRAAGRLKIPGTHALDPLLEGEVRSGVEFTLQLAGRVRITAGDGIVGVKAEWAGPETEPKPATGFAVVRNGRGMIDGLAPGPWRLLPERGDEDPQGADPRVVTVVAGQTTRVTL